MRTRQSAVIPHPNHAEPPHQDARLPPDALDDAKAFILAKADSFKELFLCPRDVPEELIDSSRL
jgi:hypothetical protein